MINKTKVCLMLCTTLLFAAGQCPADCQNRQNDGQCDIAEGCYTEACDWDGSDCDAYACA